MRQCCSFVISENLPASVSYGSLIDGCSIRSTNEARWAAWPGTGEIENIIIWMSATEAAGVGWTFDILVEGIVRATVDITGTTLSAIIPGPINVVAGQVVLIRSTPIGSSTNRINEVAWEFVGLTPRESVYGATPDSVDVTNGTDYRGGPGAIRPWDTVLADAESITPINGAFTSLWASVFIDGIGGVGSVGGEIVLVINGVVQDGTGGTEDTRVPISLGPADGHYILSNDDFSVDVVRGDRIAVRWTSTPGTWSTTNVGVGFTFIAEDDGFSIIASTPNNNLSNTNNDDQYNAGWNPDNQTWFDTEVFPRVTRANVTSYDLGLAITRLTVAPGTGDSREFNIRLNGADSGITFTIADDELVGEDLINGATVEFGDTWGWQHIPLVSPAGSKTLLAISQFIEPEPPGPEPEPPGPAAPLSGIYQMVPGKTNDTVFTNVDLGETLVVKIPDPVIRTGPLGE